MRGIDCLIKIYLKLGTDCESHQIITSIYFNKFWSRPVALLLWFIIILVHLKLLTHAVYLFARLLPPENSSLIPLTIPWGTSIHMITPKRSRGPAIQTFTYKINENYVSGRITFYKIRDLFNLNILYFLTAFCIQSLNQN